MENESFIMGIIAGAVAVAVIWILSSILCIAQENSGYENKLIIRYHNPTQEYDRQMVLDLVDKSGIATNFANKEVSMSARRMEWRMTNPKKAN